MKTYKEEVETKVIYLFKKFWIREIFQEPSVLNTILVTELRPTFPRAAKSATVLEKSLNLRVN